MEVWQASVWACRRGKVLYGPSPYATITPSCKTLGGSAELTVDPAKFCLAYRQMRAEGIFVI